MTDTLKTFLENAQAKVAEARNAPALTPEASLQRDIAYSFAVTGVFPLTADSRESFKRGIGRLLSTTVAVRIAFGLPPVGNPLANYREGSSLADTICQINVALTAHIHGLIDNHDSEKHIEGLLNEMEAGIQALLIHHNSSIAEVMEEHNRYKLGVDKMKENLLNGMDPVMAFNGLQKPAEPSVDGELNPEPSFEGHAPDEPVRDENVIPFPENSGDEEISAQDQVPTWASGHIPAGTKRLPINVDSTSVNYNPDRMLGITPDGKKVCLIEATPTQRDSLEEYDDLDEPLGKACQLGDETCEGCQ